VGEIVAYCLRREFVHGRDTRQNGEKRQAIFAVAGKPVTLGERLLAAFKEKYGTEDKKFIAEKLGFKTDKAVYKVISGERELSFEALVRFKNSTNRSVDWLLTGEEIQPALPLFNEVALVQFVRNVLREEKGGSNGQNDIPEYSDSRPDHSPAPSGQPAQDRTPSTSSMPIEQFTLPEGVGISFHGWERLSDEEKKEAIAEIKGVVEKATSRPRRRKSKQG
jgi:plasmid maintenance system antidote protein VapI